MTKASKSYWLSVKAFEKIKNSVLFRIVSLMLVAASITSSVLVFFYDSKIEILQNRIDNIQDEKTVEIAKLNQQIELTQDYKKLEVKEIADKNRNTISELKQKVAFWQQKYELLQQKYELLKEDIEFQKARMRAESSLLQSKRELLNLEKELIENQVTSQRKQGQELLRPTKDVSIKN